MAITTYRIGTPRRASEGLRLGTVRILPRGVKKADYARKDYFDVWVPLLAPSLPLFKWIRARQDDPRAWQAFRRKYAKELERPDARHLVELVAALGERTNLAVGCYCEDESRCHRSVLREVIARAGPPGSARTARRQAGGWARPRR